LTAGRLEDLTLLGDPLAALRISDFRRGSEAKTDPGLLPAFIRRALRPVLPPGNPQDGRRGLGLVALAANTWVWHQLVTYPAAGPRCTGCGFCVRHCPAEAIAIIDGAAAMDRERCIRCYCCHELCPELAVELRRPWLARLLLRR
jgi:ferredoxin